LKLNGIAIKRVANHGDVGGEMVSDQLMGVFSVIGAIISHLSFIYDHIKLAFNKIHAIV